ncbi:MAG: ribonuclease Z [Proteobacteria bacterium]|nr:ribonuclease Z [Pseudomonadota bacterium]
MRPSFLPRLVNGPFDDPALFVPFVFEKRAVLFDLGDIHSLSARNTLKISHIFVTHAHMDHFIGFDRLLRLFLGRDQTLYIYGPEGFMANVEGKLAGYSWNLVQNYQNRFSLKVTEVRPAHLLQKEYLCQNRFLQAQPASRQPFSGILLEEPALTVHADLLDHSIPCLGFSMIERFHINIIKEHVAELGLDVGPWLNDFKQALFNNLDPDFEFEVACGPNGSRKKRFGLGDLAGRIARITPGQKVAYIVDVAYTPKNVDRIVKLASQADHLFIETAFLDKDRDIAQKKCHLTARQAGHIAAKARVKQFTPFHFSPRYTGQAQLLEQEAREAYAVMLSE